ncbi:DUF4080 domain-containing protein [Rhodoferax sp.]|uniref:B12-binding domain-containing radical SAM protein n=1 Tax=Rhodoferax sp. TaxID=50421 RepID=UPI001ECA97C0|nr:DUF4080 domain-containing protein [Rhodoferax sp.]MBT9505230.1 DUF4080 domain-containing protein [Rhodoferax sp.]
MPHPESPVQPAAPSVILCTLNAKYIHASLGLRYLLANMGDLRATTALYEFTIARQPQEIADELLAALGEPQAGAVQVVGFGVYIWNVLQTTEVLRLLKTRCPGVKVVLGGPEVSHEVDQQEIVGLADHVITGWGDVSFPQLCRALLHGPQPLMKIIAGLQPPMDEIALPYGEYTDADLAHRLLYVEASRGCPFKCEFCLSSLDKTAWAFELETFLAEMDLLYQRGARNFKFVDRTFNLKIEASVRILQFFLDRMSDDLFVHFEVIPDQLPDRLKAMIARFPPGVLQFEVGIQSFNVEVQQRISRRQDNAKTEANLRWLVNESNAHLHTDLIFGLPGESLQSFAIGFDRLHALRPHEIQLGILKRLRGTPITRHTDEYAMVYQPTPPYTVLQTAAVDAATMQRFTRFSRYWDMIANSGRFKQTLDILLDGHTQAGAAAPSPFAAFLGFADWLWQTTGKTNGLSPEALVDALFDYLSAQRGLPTELVRQALLGDYVASGARANPQALQGLLPKREAPQGTAGKGLTQRQAQHLLQDQALR